MEVVVERLVLTFADLLEDVDDGTWTYATVLLRGGKRPEGEAPRDPLHGRTDVTDVVENSG